ncbi:MAG: hypothetical protein JW755_13195, partial [Candidatus Aminicenantes bacterium]|nr:hypothetical protein [Candidatus Aminicenantes bacterium]
MKMLKKILFFFSLFLIYLIIKEFLTLYVQIKSLHPYAAYAFLVLVCFVFAYFVIIPVLKILALPRVFGPIRNRELIPAEISKRMQNFRNNAYLQSIDFDISTVPENQEGYDQVVKQLEKKAENLRKIHVSQMFYSTAIAQNGFLDALFILSGSINHIKEMFALYHGRISNRELWIIARKIYYSMAIGGSEGVEYATEEIISKFASQGLKSIPFIDKILSSLADGLVNAT